MASWAAPVQSSKNYGLPEGGDLDILLVGKTGTGKSSTANSILDETYFDEDCGVNSKTVDVTVLDKTMDGRTLLVVDTPGLCSTKYLGRNDEKKAEKVSEELGNHFIAALSASEKGFHAIILILEFGGRMGQEEVSAIEQLKVLWEEDFIKNHGVLLLTNGQRFEHEKKKKNKNFDSFESWCKQQDGCFASLLNECQHRCMLFENLADENELREQRIKLIQMIDRMSKGKRYMKGIFKEIETSYQTGQSKLDPDAQKQFLNVSRIQAHLCTLVKSKKTFDENDLRTMRGVIQDLKNCIKNMPKNERCSLDQRIEDASSELDTMETEVIKSPTHQIAYTPRKTMIAVDETRTSLKEVLYAITGILSIGIMILVRIFIKL